MSKVNLLVLYYSMTDTNYQISKWAETAAIDAGATVKLAKVKELAPSSTIEKNAAWKSFAEQTHGIHEIELGDLDGQTPSFSAHPQDLGM